MSLRISVFNLLASQIKRKSIIRAWDDAEINRVNNQGLIINCPYCGHNISALVTRWNIDSQFGLYDNNKDRLRTIYALNITSLLSEKFQNQLRKLAFQWITGRSHVDYRKCQKCGLIFQNYPHTSESTNFYYNKLYRLPWQEASGNHDDIVVYGRNDHIFVQRKQLIASYFIDLTKLPAGSKILDVGCAEGLVCKHLTELGMEAYGIEPSEPMANYAQLVLKLHNIQCADYTHRQYPVQYFDGIISHHVAEHIVDTKSFFDALAHHLKIGGFLLLQVPCVDNFRVPKDSDKILSGGHIYGFTSSFLHSVLESKGFKIVEQKLTPCDLNELEPSERFHHEASIWGDHPCGITIFAIKQ